MHDLSREFLQAIESAGLVPPESIEADGRLHRFSSNGKRDDDAGWYILHGDGIPAGCFGDWRSGLSQNWRADVGRSLTASEEAAHRARVEAMRRNREQEEKQRKEDAARKAGELFKSTSPELGTHRYLADKNVRAYGLKTDGHALLVPMRDASGALRNLQRIFPNGDKRFLSGGQVTGCYHAIGNPDGVICIAEGYATGATIHEATGHAVAIAFNAGNLEPVARALRGKLPKATLIVCADDDAWTEGNPGLTKAKAAALAVNGLLAVPSFGDSRPERATDFNDLANHRSSEAVRTAVAAAKPVATESTGTSPQSLPALREWPQPVPLPEGLPPVAAFDLELLPATLKPWVGDICERVQCAPDFVAVAAMTGLGSVLGRKLSIRPQARTDWSVTPNLWALAVGRPGVLKSPAMEAALSPVKRLAALATETHQAEMDEFVRAAKLARMRAEESEKAARKALAKSHDADVSALLANEEPEEPALRRYICNDSTAAALGEILRLNPNGLLVFRDELVSLLKGLDREDQAEARGFYLTAWNGDSPYTFDRIGRGMNLHIPAVCISLLGSTQPGRIAEYVRHAVKGGAGDDGLIQRFGLLVWPDIGGEWRDVDRWPDGEAKREAHRIFEYLDQLDPEKVGAQQDKDHAGEPDGLPFLRFDSGAHGLFLEWRTDLEKRLREGDMHPAMESHLSKYRKLVPGLALIIHLSEGGTGPVTERATLKALAWAEYLETHAQRAYASITSPEVTAAKTIVQRLRKGDLPHTFSSRDVWRPGWANLSDRNLVTEALQLLVDLDWLASNQHQTGGRPATIFEANPKGLQ